MAWNGGRTSSEPTWKEIFRSWEGFCNCPSFFMQFGGLRYFTDPFINQHHKTLAQTC
jgi:hypothetical protein